MTIEQRLALKPRERISFEFLHADGRLEREGREYHRVTFLDQTETLEGSKATMHGDARKIVDGIVGELDRQQPPIAPGIVPFNSIPPDDVGQLYLDIYGMFPGYPVKAFRERVAAAEKDLGEKVKQMYLNSLANEPEFRNAFYLNRIALNAMHLPAVIHGVLESRGFLQEGDKTYNVKRALAGILAYALRKASFDYDPDVRAQVKANFSGKDPHPYLNGSVNEFVLSGMEPTPRAVERALSYPNAYGMTPVVYARIKAALNKMFNGNADKILSNPENVDKMLNDGEAIAQIRAAMGDASGIVAPVEAVRVARELLRRRFAAGYPQNPEGVQRLKELQGYVATEQALQAVETLLKGSRKDFYARMGIDPSIQKQIEMSAEKVASAKKDAVQEDAVRAALSGYSRLATNMAVYYDLRRIVGTPESWKERDWKAVEFVMPEATRLDDIADDFRNRSIYVFSGKGGVFHRKPSETSPTAPGIILPSTEDTPVVGFADLRNFTNFLDEYGETSGGIHILDVQDRMANALIDPADGKVEIRAGDGLAAFFYGPNAAQRYIHATSRAMEALQEFNEAAEKAGDIQLRAGIGGHTGRRIIARTNLRTSKTEKGGSQYIGTSINTASRLSGSSEELTEILENSEYFLPIDLDDETFRKLANKEIPPDQLLRKKPVPYRIGALVSPNGRFGNFSNIVTQAVVDRLRKELPDGIRSKMIAPVEDDKIFVLSNYFDPSQGMNAEIPHLEPIFEVLYFHDAIGDRPVILRKLPHKAAVRGIKEPTEIYEIVPSRSVLYECI